MQMLVFLCFDPSASIGPLKIHGRITISIQARCCQSPINTFEYEDEDRHEEGKDEQLL